MLQAYRRTCRRTTGIVFALTGDVVMLNEHARTDLEPTMTSEDKYYNQVQLMTMSAVDFLDQWFETDVLKATMSASRHYRIFPRRAFPGHGLRFLHHYMGEIDGAFRSWGFARGGTGAISNAIADAAREAGAEIRTKASIAQIIVKTARPRAWFWQTATRFVPTSFLRALILG